MRHRGHRFPFGQPGAGQQQSALRAPARERQAGFSDEQARQRPSAGADPAAIPLSTGRRPDSSAVRPRWGAACGRTASAGGMGRDGAAANSSSRVSTIRAGRRPAARRRARRRCAGSARAAGLTSSTQGCAGRPDRRSGRRTGCETRSRPESSRARTAAGQPGRLQRRQLADAISQEQGHAALRLEQLSAPVAVPVEACARPSTPSRPPGRRPGQDRSRHRRRKSALSDSLCFDSTS